MHKQDGKNNFTEATLFSHGMPVVGSL
uniref:Uncharacterized protein n=1 Tax=Anguilla anguilla TaxID=7936 RepID=A0A0E9PK02_ANGAN